MTHRYRVVPFVTLLGSALLAACGGGSAYVSTGSSGITAANLPSGNQPPAGLNYDTGKPGTVGAPVPAANSSAPAQIATSSSPQFLNPSSPSSATFPANVTFPAVSTSLQFTAAGLTPATPNQGATVTVVSMTNLSRTLQLNIPAVNVNATVFDSNVDASPDEGITTNLKYVALGSWGTGTSGRFAWQAPHIQTDLTQFAFGYDTAPAALPKSGTAAFQGSAYANVFKPVDGTIRGAIVLGGAALSVDFSSGAISGNLTNFKQAESVGLTGTPTFLPWNDVSVAGSIAGGTSHFSGTTKATSTPNTAFSLGASATGYINGGFYGPAAEELGAVWSLSDGNGAALGGISATR